MLDSLFDIEDPHIGQVVILLKNVVPHCSHFVNFGCISFQPIHPAPAMSIGVNRNNIIIPPAISSKNLPAAEGRNKRRTIANQINLEGLFITYKEFEA